MVIQADPDSNAGLELLPFWMIGVIRIQYIHFHVVAAFDHGFAKENSRVTEIPIKIIVCFVNAERKGEIFSNRRQELVGGLLRDQG